MKPIWLMSICFMNVLAHAQSIRATPVTTDPVDQANSLRFYCAEGYKSTSCREDVLKVRSELARFPVVGMGQWSFVLVPSDQWKYLVLRLGGTPKSPAFSVLGNRTTVLEQALFSPSAGRAAELLAEYGSLRDLLRIAITHELGHAICEELDERRADDYGRELRAGRVPHCKKGTANRSAIEPR